MAGIRATLMLFNGVPDFFIGKTLAFLNERPIVQLPFFSGGMKISDISWDTVRMVSIDQCTLRITTDIAVHTYAFTTPEELSEALLILSLSGTRKVEDKDDARFNPARFLPGYQKRNAKVGRLGGGQETGFLTDGPARWGI